MLVGSTEVHGDGINPVKERLAGKDINIQHASFPASQSGNIIAIFTEQTDSFI